MKGNMVNWALLLMGSFVMLSGCAVVEQVHQHQKEALVRYEAPKRLEGNTQDTGILLVDAVFELPLNKLPLNGVAIANVADPGKEIVVGRFNTGSGLFGTGASEVVVIPNLRPGTYRIVKINTAGHNMRETLFMPRTCDFEFEIAPGTPIYFGQIKVKRKFGSSDTELQIQYDQQREAKSWKVVADKFSDSPWATIITAHITTLE